MCGISEEPMIHNINAISRPRPTIRYYYNYYWYYYYYYYYRNY